MNDLVDVIGSDTGLGLAGGNIQHLTRKPADLAHTILLLLCEDLDPVPASEDLSCSQLLIPHQVVRCKSTHLLALRDAVRCVVGVPDAGWDLSPGAQRV